MRAFGIGMGAAALAAAILSVAATPAAAEGVLGLWATPGHNGKVMISACGAGICGKVVDGDELRANPNQRDVLNKDKALRNRPIRNMPLFENYAGGPPLWKGGPVYDPQSGDVSRTGQIKLISPDVLEIKGCLGPLCRSEKWRRVK